jgi:hypothetical protein
MEFGAALGKILNSWDYVNVSGVEVKHGMTTRAIVIQVPGVVPIMRTGRMDQGPGTIWHAPNALFVKSPTLDSDVARIRELVANHQQRPATGASPDPIDQLRRLAELRDKGIVTTAEFDAKKKQLLGI